MTTTIWKFPVPEEDSFAIQMPYGAGILCVQTQGDRPFVWAEVDPERETEGRTFRLFGTGHPQEVDGMLDYVGTFQVRGGALVFHLYEAHEFEDAIPF